MTTSPFRIRLDLHAALSVATALGSAFPHTVGRQGSRGAEKSGEMGRQGTAGGRDRRLSGFWDHLSQNDPRRQQPASGTGGAALGVGDTSCGVTFPVLLRTRCWDKSGQLG